MKTSRTLLVLLLFLLGCGSGGSDVRSLTILHTSDLHARFLPDSEGRGGFAQVATAIRQEQARAPDSTLVLHAGDFVQGTPVSTIFEGSPVWEVANHLGLDVNTLGNHEFDYGWRKIPEFLSTAEFPTVSANVVDGEGRLLTEQAYVVREVNGIRVAVIGALTADLPKISKTEFRGPWRALPVAETVERYAREVRDQVDLVVVLSHTFDYEDDQVLERAKNVDVVVAGHNHGGQGELKQVDGRICVKVRAYGRELGRLDLRVDRATKDVVAYDWKKLRIEKGRYPPDPTVAKLVDKWEAKVSEIVDVPIGESKQRLGSRDLKPLIERVMAEAVGADLAYMNRGGIRDALPEGELQARHIWNMLPFGNTIYAGRVAGRELPKEVSDGRSIDPDREYLLATNSFIGAKWIEGGLALTDRRVLIRDLLIDWIREQKVVRR
jgi:2',3'-cyclic-nucleotide 2'-phosphodiesterase (5'-nucleotidase family)